MLVASCKRTPAARALGHSALRAGTAEIDVHRHWRPLHRVTGVYAKILGDACNPEGQNTRPKFSSDATGCRRTRAACGWRGQKRSGVALGSTFSLFHGTCSWVGTRTDYSFAQFAPVASAHSLAHRQRHVTITMTPRPPGWPPRPIPLPVHACAPIVSSQAAAFRTHGVGCSTKVANASGHGGGRVVDRGVGGGAGRRQAKRRQAAAALHAVCRLDVLC